MYIRTGPALIANAEAQAATVDNAGMTEFFFQTGGRQSFIVSGLEIDRSGRIIDRAGQVLGVGYTDPSLPKIYSHPYGHGASDPTMQFTSALTEANGSILLFSLNQRSTRSYDEEYSSPYIYVTSNLKHQIFTAYRLGDMAPGENGLISYADYAFTIVGNSEVAHDELIWEDESHILDGVSSTEIVDRSVLTFDSGAMLVSYRLDMKADGSIITEYWPDPPVEGSYHTESSTISYQFVDMNAETTPAAVVLDDTPVGVSVVVDRPADQLGVIWIDSASSSLFRLAMVSVDATGQVARNFRTYIVASDLEGAPTLGDMTVLDAAAAVDGSIVAIIENAGRPYLALFDRGLHLQGEISAIIGGRWAGSSAEHVSETSIVRLPDGGFVLGLSLETDLIAGGADHRLLIQQYDSDGVQIGRSVKVSADGAWFNLSDMGDGVLSLAWTDGGNTYSEILDTRLAGITEVGTDGVDLLLGTAFGDVLQGYGDADLLIGAAGRDQLYGGAGNDVLIGGDGADRLDGGEGRDTARYDAAVIVDLLDRSLNAGQARGDLLISIEKVSGSSEADSFFGSDTVDTLEGKGGDDTLVGRGGDDILIGGVGADLSRGGAGADQFRFTTLSDGRDTIADFVSGEDKIAISKAGFDIGAINLVTNIQPSPSDAAPVFLFERDTGLLSFDADGNGVGKAVDIAFLVGVTQLHIEDFLLI
ncbi:calcium-binding protein [Zavarzinia sp.]|uniref:calcium-binding protein n=1 Tax=Zavarzinia sp. TaxID=2027920 RepID=UPI003BB6F80D